MAKFFSVLMGLLVWAIRAALRSQADLVLENVALRQQVTALKQERPRPRLHDADRAFWVALRSAWPDWATRLVLVTPDRVARWHRRRFRRYWTRLCCRPRTPGRPRVAAELRILIQRMATDNGWDAPRVHGERLELGLQVSERTVSRYMPRKSTPPDMLERWVAFLRNHREAIAGMDFFVVPTATMRVLYGFFLGLGKDTPAGQPLTPRPSASARVVALPRVGGLHHRYEWREAA